MSKSFANKNIPSIYIPSIYPLSGRPKSTSSQTGSVDPNGTTRDGLRASQSKTNSPAPRPSGAIAAGADRIVALIEEETARIEARSKEQLRNLEVQFDEYRNYASQEHQRLADRIRALEDELKVKSDEDAKGDFETQIDDNLASHLNLDMETTRLLSELARLLKAAKRSPNQQGATLDIRQLQRSEPFLPALSHYLASHNEAIHHLQEKLHAAEKECNGLKEHLGASKASLLVQLRNTKREMSTASELVPSVPFIPSRHNSFEMDAIAIIAETSKQPPTESLDYMAARR